MSLDYTLESFGYKVFIDWIVSPELDRTTATRETADELRRAMSQSDSLLFAVSSSSKSSKWMPWELGYSDALHGKVAVIPIYEMEMADEVYDEQEYLGLYPYVTINRKAQGEVEFVINEAIDKYVSLGDWLKGEEPKQQDLFTKVWRERYGVT